MAFPTGYRVSVGASVTPLNTDVCASVVVHNKDATNSIDVGNLQVVYGSGYQLAPGDSIGLDLEPGQVLYGISSGPSVIVHVIENQK